MGHRSDGQVHGAIGVGSNGADIGARRAREDQRWQPLPRLSASTLLAVLDPDSHSLHLVVVVRKNQKTFQIYFGAQ